MSTLSTNAVLLKYRKHSDSHSLSSDKPPLLSGSTRRALEDAAVSIENKALAPDAFSPREASSPAIMTPPEEACITETRRRNVIESNNSQRFIDADWDQINHEAEQQWFNKRTSSLSMISEDQGSIGFLDAVRCLKSDTFTWEPYAASHRFGERKKRNCLRLFVEGCRETFCSGRCFASKDREACVASDSKSILEYDTEFTLALPFVPLDQSHPIHQRLLATIQNNPFHRKKGADNGSRRTGAIDWETLGFQGSDPATDLRSTGIFCLLQLIYLIEYYGDFAMKLWDTCINGGSGASVYEELPFVLVGSNFSGVLLEMLKDNEFYADIRHRARTLPPPTTKAGRLPLVRDTEQALICEFPLFFICCEYYIGCLFLFWECWQDLKMQRDGKQPTIGDFGVVKAKLCAKLKKNGPQYVFDTATRARNSANGDF
ncbi:ELMO domain-containing protein 2 [Trypanosoma rangeli]|uniref:ELMO domain-containing protein 2 n=1 Tax=Trypanosoma rangeli TaxID=5698 RepID=A0A3R7KXF4_TRYRA|nr:ELMO domain-containing protein 2 [Trypanosoma rangeli]RNF03268.1 ELMO domain-containing protein 2 [Trypanosoma rangeli]|eukprot:RNF03268.1 ELMO domain-containing protein 2 [Trypanosoma rangeli]